MILVPAAVEVPESDPFANDLLSRKKVGETLTALLEANREPLVLCINAEWGGGKTTFLRMWRQMLINNGLRTLHFNAWENDFTDDAFVAIMGEIELGIESMTLSPAAKTAARARLRTVTRIGAGIAKRAVPAAVKAATLGILDWDDAMEKAIADQAEKVADEQIKNYEKAKKSVGAFKEALRDFAAGLSSATGENRPVVVLIDELDRCKPTYAIKVLEAVKHLFSVENVVFVLALDREQLGHSVRSAYGAGTDVAGYLRRFIDLDYNLPLPKIEDFVAAQFARYELSALLQERKQAMRQVDDHGEFRHVLSELAQVMACTPRDIERVFTMLSVAIKTTQKGYRLYPLLLGPLALLKIKNHELYLSLVRGTAAPSAVLSFWATLPGGRAFVESNLGIVVELLLVASASIDREEAVAYYKALYAGKDERRLDAASAQLDHMSFNEQFGMLDYVAGKIDFVADFGRR